MKPPEQARYAQTLQACNQLLREHWQRQPYTHKPPLVLEAGGGSFSHFALPSDAALLALDIDFGQLRRNTATPLRIQGDLHKLPLAPAAVDIVVCFNVIEHLDEPDSALRQMAESLHPGGILILGCPDRNSLKGQVTRMTPLSLHRAFYRYIVRKADRGDGHYDAFATPFRPLVSVAPLGERLQQLGFELQFSRAYDGAYEYGLTQGSTLRRCFGLPYYALGWLGTWLSGKRWQALHSDLLIVARKTGEAAHA